jgi:hypothetical protein
MTFKEKLKKASPKVKPGTLRLYLQNARRLYKMSGGGGELPETGSWLMKDVVWTKLKNMPVNTRRHLSLAGLKSSYAYKVSEKQVKKWYGQMIRDSAVYQENRNKNKATDAEKKLLPKGGIGALQKASKELKKRLRFVLAAEPTLKGLYRIQWWIALKLFTQVPFRNTFATITIGGDKGNVLETPRKGNFKFVMRDFKNSDKLGERTVPLSRAISMALRKFLKYRSGLVKHKHLFTGYHGDPMTRAGFGKALQNTYEDVLGARLGSRIIRIIHANSEKDALKRAQDLSNKMLHTPKQSAQYVKE